MKRSAICTSLFAALAILTIMSASRPAAQDPSPSTEAGPLDYQFFKTRVEPIFLKKRPGHARCYLCHVDESGTVARNSAFRLEKLPLGSTFWTEDQSRRNFDGTSRLVTPGEPLSSRLLMHPLASDAGGDIYHTGGRQFASQSDPDWMTLAEWVRGKKAGGSSGK